MRRVIARRRLAPPIEMGAAHFGHADYLDLEGSAVAASADLAGGAHLAQSVGTARPGVTMVSGRRWVDHDGEDDALWASHAGLVALPTAGPVTVALGGYLRDASHLNYAALIGWHPTGSAASPSTALHALASTYKLVGRRWMDFQDEAIGSGAANAVHSLEVGAADGETDAVCRSDGAATATVAVAGETPAAQTRFSIGGFAASPTNRQTALRWRWWAAWSRVPTASEWARLAAWHAAGAP